MHHAPCKEVGFISSAPSFLDLRSITSGVSQRRFERARSRSVCTPYRFAHRLSTITMSNLSLHPGFCCQIEDLKEGFGCMVHLRCKDAIEQVHNLISPKAQGALQGTLVIDQRL